jgi:hypothetical protein
MKKINLLVLFFLSGAFLNINIPAQENNPQKVSPFNGTVKQSAIEQITPFSNKNLSRKWTLEFTCYLGRNCSATG